MILDILFVILIGAAFYQGYKMGIIHTVFSIIGYALGVLLAVKLNEQMVLYLGSHWKVNPALLPYLSFFLLLLIIVLLFRLIAWSMERLLQAFSLDRLNKVIGSVLYGSLAAFIFSLMVWYAASCGFIPQDTKQKSYSYRYLSPMAPGMIDAAGLVIPAFHGMFDRMQHEFKQGEKHPGTVVS
jgi:membrane protein required for colicin V production